MTSANTETARWAGSARGGVAVKRETIVEQLARGITDEILAGRLAAGSLLPPERELAKSLGVTRTSLKHTLARLEQSGLIATRHGVGSEVLDFAKTAGAGLLPLLVRSAASKPNEWIGEWIGGLFEARRLFGAIIAGEAARNRSELDVEELNSLVDELSFERRAERLQEIEAEVHRVIARSSANPVFVLVVNSILDAYISVAPLLIAPFGEATVLVDLLGPVVEAIASGDVSRARERSEQYLSITGDTMLAALGIDALDRAATGRRALDKDGDRVGDRDG